MNTNIWDRNTQAVAKNAVVATKSGFTLIELLVVIAIIGILAAIILASVSSAKRKGGDAAVKTDLVNLRTEGELDYSNNNCYSDSTCTATASIAACAQTAGTIFHDSSIWNQIQGAKGAGGSNAACSITANNTAYAVAVQLNSSNTLAWCVDSSDQSKQETITANTPTTAISATTHLCN